MVSEIMSDKIFIFENDSRHGKVYNTLGNISKHFGGIGLQIAKELYKGRTISEYKLVLVKEIKCAGIIDGLIEKADKRTKKNQEYRDKAEIEKRKKEYERLKQEFE